MPLDLILKQANKVCKYMTCLCKIHSNIIFNVLLHHTRAACWHLYYYKQFLVADLSLLGCYVCQLVNSYECFGGTMLL